MQVVQMSLLSHLPSRDVFLLNILGRGKWVEIH